MPSQGTHGAARCAATVGLRLHAAEWHIDPHKIGVLGFSAGGSGWREMPRAIPVEPLVPPALRLKGRAESTVPLGSEVLQQPRSIEGLPGAVMPTTITYAVRIVPSGALPIHGWGVEKPKLTLDFGVAQAAGNIMPGVDLQARHQFAFGISYGF